MKQKKNLFYFGMNLLLLSAVLCFPLYRKAAQAFPLFSGCFLHDRLLLYCPLCGGTRAVSALLAFDFATAWRCNPAVVVMIAGFVLLDGTAFIRLLRKKEKLCPFPDRMWLVFVGALVGYGIVRNVLMIGFGIDPLGDLGGYWAVIRSAGLAG